MTPHQWEAMSWHQRLAYLRNLTTYEAELRRLSAQVRAELDAANDRPHYPDPAWTIHTAKQLHRLIPPDPPEVIKQRIKEWIGT